MRPLTLHAHQVKAILAGELRQLRYVITPQPPFWCKRFEYNGATPVGYISGLGTFNGTDAEAHIRCPLQRWGNQAWCQEPWSLLSVGPAADRGTGSRIRIRYHADNFERVIDAGGCLDDWIRRASQPKPETVMTRDMSRLILSFTEKRIEPVQSISEDDATQCGARAFMGQKHLTTARGRRTGFSAINPSSMMLESPRDTFRQYWVDLYGAPAWEQNPKVAVLSFDAEVVHPPA